MKFEKRYLEVNEDVQFRITEEDNKRYLIGYAAIFNSRSKLIFENGKMFFEIIDRGAFDDVLNDPTNDVYLTYNHSIDQIIARTVSGTLELSSDETGLRFKALLPNNVSYANDVYELVERGDLFQNSFAFIVGEDGQEWNREDGNLIRTIKKVQKLLDVSVVVKAAYPETTLSARDFEEFEKEETENKDEEIIEDDTKPNDIEKYRMKLKLLKQYEKN